MAKKTNSKAKSTPKGSAKAKAPKEKKAKAKKAPQEWNIICPRDNWRNPIPATKSTVDKLEQVAIRLDMVSNRDNNQHKLYLDLKVGGENVKAPEFDDPHKVSSHFSLAEFGCNDGTPVPGWGVPLIRQLCNDVLEPIRTHPLLEGSSLRVSSGYRTPSYNARIGGATFSQHKECRAADIYSPELEDKYGTRGMVDRIIRVARETKATGIGVSYANFVHVDIRPGPRVEW